MIRWPRDSGPAIRLGLLLAALAALYFAAAQLGLSLAFVAPQVTVVWPPTGIALAALILFGLRAWPAVWLGALLANAPVAPLAVAVGIATGNTLEAVVGAWLLGRLGFRPSLERMRDVAILVGAGGIASTMISATIGLSSLCIGGVQPWSAFARIWIVWWLGDAMSVLVVAPLLLVWRTWPPQWSARRIGEALALLAGLVGALWLVFATPVLPDVRHPLPYLMFPFVIVAALRLGQPATTAVNAVASIGAIWGTAAGVGPFGSGDVGQDVVQAQLFLAVLAVTGLILASATSERAQLLERERVARSEAELANRAKDEFLAMLGHELRNPLGAITNAAGVLDGVAGDRRIAAVRGIIARQAAHLARLVDDLLDVARVQTGRVELRREAVDLGQLIERCAETATPPEDSRDRELRISTTSLLVDGDPARLAQIVTNLLANALKYTPPGGHICVETSREGDQAIVRVRDDGVGISPELLPRVFDLFVQADRSLDRSKGGLGLGLTLVKRLVGLHGGTVTAHSAGPGRGSEFVVALPLAAARGVPEADAERKVGVRARRVLVIEDHEDVRESLRLLLDNAGHSVVTADDGVDGLALLRGWRPDVAIVDIGLPGLDGYAVARAVRADPELSGVLLVALTGYGQLEDERRAIAAGFHRHLVKPVSLETLGRVLGDAAALSPSA